ncbi:MAG: tetratricopeptide repeat protein [Candidatus Sabulitectum sp.]|nr:tetratricopeptide repeat protein [Candidatus Sabulitectum sp.]
MDNTVSQKKPFFGRERELSELTERILDPECRILTITGIGGVGKTTIALELAGKLHRHFRNGICFVSLAGLEHSGQVAPAVVSKLGIRLSGGNITKQLLDALAGKNILLVLDNFEHLISATLLVEKIGLEAESVKLLVTSRTGLNVAGEFVYELSGMHIPDESLPDLLFSSAPVKLFLSSYEIEDRFDPDDLRAVAQICREVDGVPLGIELASSWLGRMTPSEILIEISGKGKLLNKQIARKERRHSSLRRVFDYSWMQLSREERTVFTEISVFHGGFDAEAVEFITGRSRIALIGLRNKSLLKTEPSERFSLHPLLRDFSSGKLEQQPDRKEALIARHAEYYCGLLAKNEKNLLSDGSSEAMEEITANLSEVRTAITNSIRKGMSEAFAAGSAALRNYLLRQGFLEEGRKVFMDASAMFKDIIPEESLMMKASQAAFSTELTMYDEAAALLETVLTGGKQEVIGKAAHSLGMVYMRTGNLSRAENRMNRALELARASGDRELEVTVLGGLGDLFNHRLESEKARYFMMQAVEINKKTGNIRGLFSNWITLSNIMANHKKGDSALEYANLALECTDSLKGDLYIALARISIAAALEIQGELKQALDFAVQAVHLFEGINNRWGIQASCRTKASIESSLGMVEESIKTIGKSIQLSEEIGGTYNAMESFITAAEIFEKAGNTEKAFDLYLRARKISRNNSINIILRKLDKKLEELKG